MSVFKGFSSVELRKPKRSKFDMSHEKRMSTRMGKLTPVFVAETIPNDTWRVSTEVMLRLAPLLAPIMHRVNVYVHFFFVPMRLLWKDWEAFITNGRIGNETPPVPPWQYINSILSDNLDFLDKGHIFDYLGGRPIPDADAVSWANRKIHLMPFAAYYKCWYDYYRDRNYIADNTLLPMVSGQDGNAVHEHFDIQQRSWEKDQFTSALPWTQRGSEVLMPLQGTGTVSYLDEAVAARAGGGNVSGGVVSLEGTAGVTLPFEDDLGNNIQIKNIDEVQLTASEVSINDFRVAMRLQEWMERQALAGSRYNETIWAHFQRRTSDGRLQRAEYLGGGKVAVKISEVVTTAFSDDGTGIVPAGNMAGHGLSFGNSNRFTYNCEDHGFILGIMSVMPTSGYMQGTPKMFFGRNQFEDYPWPTFAHLGEEPVYDYQLYTDPTSVPTDIIQAPVFGYQSRYYDWKQLPSSSHGDFRDSLDFWHLTRKFSAQPDLGQVFVEFEDALQDRVFAVSGVDTLWVYLYNNASVVRSLPYFGTPML